MNRVKTFTLFWSMALCIIFHSFAMEKTMLCVDDAIPQVVTLFNTLVQEHHLESIPCAPADQWHTTAPLRTKQGLFLIGALYPYALLTPCGKFYLTKELTGPKEAQMALWFSLFKHMKVCFSHAYIAPHSAPGDFFTLSRIDETLPLLEAPIKTEDLYRHKTPQTLILNSLTCNKVAYAIMEIEGTPLPKAELLIKDNPHILGAETKISAPEPHEH